MANNFFRKDPLILSQLRWLSWHGFPHMLNVSNFSLEDLVILDLSRSDIKSSWSGWRRVKMAKNLKVLNLTRCQRLVRTPNFSSHPKLERLILQQCCKLEEIDESITKLEHLVVLDLRDCERLRKLPQELSCTESLEELIITGTNIVEIPNWPPLRRLRVFEFNYCRCLKTVGSLDFAANITELRMDDSSITVLPDSIRNMVNLQKLSLARCRGINMLPESISELVSLIYLNLSCSGIAELPNTIGDLRNLNVLRAVHTPLRELPIAIEMLENLITLGVSYSGFSDNIPKLPQSSVSLEAMSDKMPRIPDLSRLINLKDLELWTPYGGDYPFEDNPAPWWIGSLTNLQGLALGFGHIISLNADLGALHELTSLEIKYCDQIQSIPRLPPGLEDLTISDCGSLGSLINLPSGLTSLAIYRCRSLTVLDVSYLRKLSYLKISETPICKVEEICSCESLKVLYMGGVDFSEIDWLEMLKNVIVLVIWDCKELLRVPDLSSLKKLITLAVLSCPNLIEIRGRSESLSDIQIEDCASLVRIPDIPNPGGRFRIKNCRKLDKSLLQTLGSTAF